MDQDLAGYREGTHTVLAVSRAGGSTQVLVPALIFYVTVYLGSRSDTSVALLVWQLDMLPGLSLIGS